MNIVADIRIKGTFFTHYKTLKLAKKVGWEAVTRLQQLWFFASENRPDGNLTNMDDDDIALSAGWAGDTALFIDGLLNAGWLDGEPGARVLHDYVEHQPYVQKKTERARAGSIGGKVAADHLTDAQKTERARKAATSRWGYAKSMQSECLPDAKVAKHELSIDAKVAKHTMLSPYLTLPNLSLPNQSLDQEHIGSKDPREVEPVEKPAKKPNMQPEVEAIFKFWSEVMSKPGAKLSPKRKARIEWALKEYGDDRARKAIIGCASSAFHMGENEQGKRFDDLELIFRNSEKFESFESLGEKARTYQDAVTGFTVVAVTPPEEKGRARGQKEQPHPFFDNKGQEFGIVKMMRRRAEEEARKEAERNANQGVIIDAE